MLTAAIFIGILAGIDEGSVYSGILIFYVVLTSQVVIWIAENND